MGTFWQDLHYAVRLLWKCPGFIAVAVLTLALGAPRGGDLFSLVVKFGLQLAAVGVGIGFLGSLIVGRFLNEMLFGVIGLDPVTYIAVPLLLGAVALAACAIPAWRAMRVDPWSRLSTNDWKEEAS